MPERDEPRPFPEFTGAGVRIAVVDSGVHPDHPHIAAGQLAPGVAIASDGTIETGADATRDRLGHGTAVAAAIQEKAPGATLIPVRVFRDALKTSAAALVAAIRWAVAQEVDLINLSLGSPNAAHRDVFARAADEAAWAGTLILAAREANEAPCYPGALPPVLGIGLDWDWPRTGYRPDGEGFATSGYPRPIPGVPQQRNLYGISFAVAQMSGFAALATESLEVSPRSPARLSSIREALAAEVCKTAS
jgi:subtilisin family serine protease